jgi:hypothetical protein
VTVGVVEHAGEGCLQPGEEALLLGTEVRPGTDVVVARRQHRLGRHDAESLLARQPALALDIPALREDRVVAADDVRRRLVRCMHRT